ncbi:hypothetical protein [Agitococcus lubricus]|uniref:Uncharacterized protein n=1 Tax=Agitococcus lubricus TaxID=1077255 RepID=A0A2T5IPZ4_9GAMM|nr:hypothetical protein [Agitococcus lubricus]PTQ85895.1 hypothetical protein C8N29_1483 [Agitococcus lubricus]
MNYNNQIIIDIKRLLIIFEPYCAEKETLVWLQQAIDNKSKWIKAHNIFSQIREKLLKSEKFDNQRLISQYLFEEVCAKTLYNLSGQSAPFDLDSPYWILPNALRLANNLGLDQNVVLSCITY